MNEKAPERIWVDTLLTSDDWDDEDPEVEELPHVPYIRADIADEWKRKLDIMQKALIEIEMFQGPASYERLPRMARKALEECGVEK